MTIGVEIFPKDEEEIKKRALEMGVISKIEKSPFNPEKIIIEVKGGEESLKKFFDLFWKTESWH